MQIFFRSIAVFGAALLLGGCSSDKTDSRAAAPQPEKVVIRIEADNVSDAPEVKMDPTAADQSADAAAKRDAKKRQDFLEKEKRRAEKEQLEKDRNAGAFVGDLNETEQEYLQSVREKNRRSKEASGSKVFGGFFGN